MSIFVPEYIAFAVVLLYIIRLAVKEFIAEGKQDETEKDCGPMHGNAGR